LPVATLIVGALIASISFRRQLLRGLPARHRQAKQPAVSGEDWSCRRALASARHRLLFRFAPKNVPKLHFEEILAVQIQTPNR
jgi:hypothetical protein